MSYEVVAQVKLAQKRGDLPTHEQFKLPVAADRFGAVLASVRGLLRGKLLQPGVGDVGYLFPAVLRGQQMRAAGKLVKILERGRAFVTLVVRLDDVRGHEMIQLAGDQEQRRAVGFSKLTRSACCGSSCAKAA